MPLLHAARAFVLTAELLNIILMYNYFSVGGMRVADKERRVLSLQTQALSKLFGSRLTVVCFVQVS